MLATEMCGVRVSLVWSIPYSKHQCNAPTLCCGHYYFTSAIHLSPQHRNYKYLCTLVYLLAGKTLTEQEMISASQFFFFKQDHIQSIPMRFVFLQSCS